MARTDNDSWDITESVGATALGVAMARATETQAAHPLFIDRYAQLFIDAATQRGWQPQTSGPMAERRRAIAGYAAARTKWFDEHFIAAGAHGIEQVVILAAGLDARCWRLPWVDGTVIYEVDQPKVLEFKAATLAAHAVPPVASYHAVSIDLRQDWPTALRQAGFDPSAATAWCAEGLLPYLSAADQDLLFDRIAELSANGSRLAVEAFSPSFFDPENLARRREQFRRMHEATRQDGDTDTPDVQDLWYIEKRTDLANWLSRRGWEVTAIEALDLMAHYGRPAPEELIDITPRSLFIDGRLTR